MTAASSSSGTLAITALASGSANVYWDDFSMNASGVSGGQQFGYDGFGNLLSQTPIVGSAPMMSLTVNPNTNQVTSGGATYDGAGNLTYDGTRNYTFDELNRMASAGTVNYSYSPGENKRMVVSGTINGQPTQLLDFFLYSPNGKLMSVFGYQKNGSSWVASQNGQTNLLYLGSKALSFAENNVGSSTTATFWPYGGVNTSGSGPGGFASYWGDWSGSYYADQRYYDYTWGRFLTADPSNGNLSLSNSGSWNRYAYVNGDPINGMDSRGLYEYDDGGDLEDDFFVDGPQGGGGTGGYGGDICEGYLCAEPLFVVNAYCNNCDVPVSGPYAGLFSGSQSVGTALTGADGMLSIFSPGALLAAGGTAIAGVGADLLSLGAGASLASIGTAAVSPAGQQIIVNIGGELEGPANAIILQTGVMGGNTELAAQAAASLASSTGQQVVLGLGNAIPFATGSVDVIIINNAPIGTGSGYFGPYIDPGEVLRVLAPGGVIAGTSGSVYNFFNVP